MLPRFPKMRAPSNCRPLTTEPEPNRTRPPVETALRVRRATARTVPRNARGEMVRSQAAGDRPEPWMRANGTYTCHLSPMRAASKPTCCLNCSLLNLGNLDSRHRVIRGAKPKRLRKKPERICIVKCNSSINAFGMAGLWGNWP